MISNKKVVYDLIELTFEQIELINLGLESLNNNTDVGEIEITEKLIEDIDKLINGV